MQELRARRERKLTALQKHRAWLKQLKKKSEQENAQRGDGATEAKPAKVQVSDWAVPSFTVTTHAPTAARSP